ncbi:MAG: PepSY-associated TM helix domain-containing protein [Verrucomicrobiota bacterium]
MNHRTPQDPRRRWRTAWLWIHRWLGLVAGFCLVLIGLTGSLFVFHHEISEWVEPQLLRVAPWPGGPTSYRPWPEILAAAEAAKPPGSRIRSLLGPEHDGSVVRINCEIPGRVPEEGDSVDLCIDPYTATVLGRSRLEEHPIWKVCAFLFELHYSLQIPKVGGTLVGILALLGLVSMATGLWLWWPGWRRIRHAIIVKRHAGSVRVNFDLHRVFGFYFVPILGALLLSGVWMNLNAPFVATVQWLSPGTQGGEPARASLNSPNGGDRQSAAEALATVLATYPGGRLNWASFPGASNEVFVVSQVEVGGPTRSAWNERMVSVDPFTGAILRVDDPSARRTAGDVFLAWQWPLHSGKAFGWTGRWLVFAGGCIPLILYATGLRIWWARRRAEIHRRNRPAQNAPSAA